eukprot:1100627-Prorocentrum_minimum.AAC.1
MSCTLGRARESTTVYTSGATFALPLARPRSNSHRTPEGRERSQSGEGMKPVRGGIQGWEGWIQGCTGWIRDFVSWGLGGVDSRLHGVDSLTQRVQADATRIPLGRRQRHVKRHGQRAPVVVHGDVIRTVHHHLRSTRNPSTAHNASLRSLYLFLGVKDLKKPIKHRHTCLVPGYSGTRVSVTQVTRGIWYPGIWYPGVCYPGYPVYLVPGFLVPGFLVPGTYLSVVGVSERRRRTAGPSTVYNIVYYRWVFTPPRGDLPQVRTPPRRRSWAWPGLGRPAAPPADSPCACSSRAAWRQAPASRAPPARICSPTGQFTPLTGEFTPLTGECTPVTGEFTPVTGEITPVT